jgi:polysaccharide biosynthesis protein PelF
MRILLGTQGTYPYFDGGVSIWCQELVNQLPQVNFELYAIRGHSSEKQIHALPPNVRGITHVSLWGIADLDAYFRSDFSPGDLRARKKNTTDYAIKTHFLPSFCSILQAIIENKADPTTLKECGEAIYRLWVYFHDHSWLTTWRHKLTWQSFAQMMTEMHRMKTVNPQVRVKDILSTAGLATSIRVMHHYFVPLIVPIRKLDIFHATAAGMLGLAGVIAKKAYNMPFILTEHGVMIREQFIFLSESQSFSLAVKQFLQKLIAFLSRLSYFYADIICPVTNYNKRWELRYGADPARIRTIYNGIDTDRFTPKPKPPETAARPTVVAAARVVPIKDIETMIQAAAIVRGRLPDVLFKIYGTLTADPLYVEQCRQLIRKLDLQNNFELCGHHNNPAEIFNIGDISILSSISEAFPLTVLESMSCERPVVSTDVGGIAEALGDCGILVRPRDAKAFAEGIIKLLSDDEMRLGLGRQARERVLKFFQVHAWANTHYELYESFLRVQPI